MNDTSTLAINLQQSEDEKASCIQLLEEMMQYEIGKRDMKVKWLRWLLVLSWLLIVGKWFMG